MAEDASYRAHPAPVGAGDALGWLLLSQFYLATVLLAYAGWCRAHGRFYLALTRVVALPFGLLTVLKR